VSHPATVEEEGRRSAASLREPPRRSLPTRTWDMDMALGQAGVRGASWSHGIVPRVRWEVAR